MSVDTNENSKYLVVRLRNPGKRNKSYQCNSQGFIKVH